MAIEPLPPSVGDSSPVAEGRGIHTLVLRLYRAQSLRFLAVGASNILVSLAVFWGLMALPFTVPYKAALCQVACYVVGMIWSFFFNLRFTFKTRGKLGPRAVRFFVLQSGCMGLSALLVGWGIDVLALPQAPVWFSVQAGITVLNYWLSRDWVFRS